MKTTTLAIIRSRLLKQHELINEDHLKELMAQIRSDGFIEAPIIVDAETHIILDGHHRFNALRILGLSKAPVFL
ncbi:MAG: hypothetical protein UV38_C0003G0047 [candidate division TM6 bacterium GW2011_GWE2_42_60]|nr:MAG: hypothetical protein UV38_C0003G0047 [candidate division TM6 bacterium GW2011_GWE2_42_60]